MTMTTADLGAVHTHVPEFHENQIKASTMYLVAAFFVAFTGAMVATMGLGGLILTAVAATWLILAFLVVLTAGG